LNGKRQRTLDQFSTSHTTALQERMALSSPCSYHAPFFAYQTEQKTWHITQGNCHHWDCPRCGLGRAKQEYGRMVEGCRTLAQNHPLFFITITCKGREITHEHAEENYLKWTDRFLTACRNRSKRKGGEWHYVQVTERQRRLHPHSHIITTFTPGDIRQGTDAEWFAKQGTTSKKRPFTFVRSDWLQGAVIRAGLGEQYDISQVNVAEAASRYVAKYLFKPSIFTTDWPKGWKRIRYSKSFPDAPKREGNAIVLLTQEDWYKLASKTPIVTVSNLDDYQEAANRLHFHDTIVRLKTTTVV